MASYINYTMLSYVNYFPMDTNDDFTDPNTQFCSSLLSYLFSGAFLCEIFLNQQALAFICRYTLLDIAADRKKSFSKFYIQAVHVSNIPIFNKFCYTLKLMFFWVGVFPSYL